MKRLILLLPFILLFSAGISAQETFDADTFVSSDGTQINYRKLSPIESAKGKKFPLIIFMHGLGERGIDNEKQLFHGGQIFLNPVHRENYPAHVIFPQCPETAFWAYKDIPSLATPPKAEKVMPAPFKAVKELIDSYLTRPDVDKSRVYIMGLSMGGCATFDMVARFPDIFAAAVPICGAIDPSRLEDLEGVSFRIFHGDADKTVPVKCSRVAYEALKKSGCKVEYYEFPGCGHGSWNPAFSRDDFMEWLFKQKKSRKYLR